MPYMALYQRLPEDLQPRLRDKLVPRVLKALTRKRPINADRTQFFLYADAFATLVKFEAVAMPGERRGGSGGAGGGREGWEGLGGLAGPGERMRSSGLLPA